MKSRDERNQKLKFTAPSPTETRAVIYANELPAASLSATQMALAVLNFFYSISTTSKLEIRRKRSFIAESRGQACHAGVSLPIQGNFPLKKFEIKFLKNFKTQRNEVSSIMMFFSFKQPSL